MLFLAGSLVGVFASQDLLLFYVFFEAMLVPLYVLVGVWGGPERVRATITFVIYTMAGSLLMLASIVAFGVTEGTFSLPRGLDEHEQLDLPRVRGRFRREGAALPVPRVAARRMHTVDARGGGAALGRRLEGRRLRFRDDRPAAFPSQVDDYRGLILVLAATGLVYGSLLAFRQPDVRGIVAYSSLSQMGLITLGLFSATDIGVNGSILQSVCHGLVSAALFLLAGMVERRTGTGELAALGGMAKGRPALAALIMVAGMFALAVPGPRTSPASS